MNKLRRGLRFHLALIALALALLIPLATGMSLYILTVLIFMLIFIIYASAWNLLAYSGQGSLGHAAFFGIGGYASSLIALKMGLSPYITIFLGGAFSAFIGILIGLTCIRLKEWFLAMVTFGFAIIAQTITVSQLAPITGGWDGIASPRFLSSETPFYSVYEYYSILALAIFTILFIQTILKSKIGLAFAAIRENELEARAAGIDTAKYKLLAFTISTYFAGVAGALEVHHFGYITPEIFGIELSFWPIIYSISGGLGTIEGPVIGTIAVTVLWDGLRALGLTYERFIIIGLMLILIVIFLPRGFISLLEKIEKSLK